MSSTKSKIKEIKCEIHNKSIIYTYKNKVYCNECLDHLLNVIDQLKEFNKKVKEKFKDL